MYFSGSFTGIIKPTKESIEHMNLDIKYFPTGLSLSRPKLKYFQKFIPKKFIELPLKTLLSKKKEKLNNEFYIKSFSFSTIKEKLILKY